MKGFVSVVLTVVVFVTSIQVTGLETEAAEDTRKEIEEGLDGQWLR